MVPLAIQHGMRPPVSPPRVLAGEGPQHGPQDLVRIRLCGPVALHRAVLATDLARPPLRQTEPVLQHLHGHPSPRRAYQFPFAISFSAAFSSSASASSRLSVEFSRSSSFSRLVSSAFIP